MKYLFNPEKYKYVKGSKPDVECILCAMKDGHPDISSLVLLRTELSAVTVNLYPYNPGHLMVFPKRHLESLSDLNEAETMEIHKLTSFSIEILQKEFSPAGFNIGYNIGLSSGASICHLHQHIVPRYKNEVGFMDVLAGTRIVVVDPLEVMKKLEGYFKNFKMS